MRRISARTLPPEWAELSWGQSYMTLSSGTSAVTSCASFCRRANPLVIVKLLRGRVFLFLEKDQLRVEQEAALFRQVSCRPLDRENAETPGTRAQPCEGDNGVQVFLPIASGTKSTHWRQFDVGQQTDACFAAALFPDCASRQFAAPTTTSAPDRVNTLHSGGMSSSAQASQNESCGPVPAAVRRTLRCTTDQSLHGFVDGPSGCQSTGSFPALFIRLRLCLPHSSAKLP